MRNIYKVSKKSTFLDSSPFVRTKEGKIYLLKPHSQMNGMGLQLLFSEIFDKKIYISSGDHWESLESDPDNESLSLIRLSHNNFITEPRDPEKTKRI